MLIRILGNGGAISRGLPYNGFLMDARVLVEVPPDIMVSLHREGIEPALIEEIFISHLHGDHCFGFPFLALELFFRYRGRPAPRALKVYVPPGGSSRLAELSAMALSEGHPCLLWMEENMDFIQVDAGRKIVLAGREASLYGMEHFEKTCGFILYEQGRALLAYTADTLWCKSVEDMIKASPAVMLLDLNGEPDDPFPVHMGAHDLLNKGITLGGGRVRFYGTHLRCQKENPPGEPIEYVRPGMVIRTE